MGHSLIKLFCLGQSVWVRRDVCDYFGTVWGYEEDHREGKFIWSEWSYLVRLHGRDRDSESVWTRECDLKDVKDIG